MKDLKYNFILNIVGTSLSAIAILIMAIAFMWMAITDPKQLITAQGVCKTIVWGVATWVIGIFAVSVWKPKIKQKTK